MLKSRHVLTVPSGTRKLLEQNYTYYPSSVKVDNYSGHWMRVDPDGVFVPPFTIGMLIDLFVQSQQVTVWAARPTNIDFGSTVNELDGTAIVSVYDSPVFPFPGTSINPPQMQRVPGVSQGSGDILPALPDDFQMIGMQYSFPLFWSGSSGNESNEHVQARQLHTVNVAEQVCVAGVQTTIAGIVPSATAQRLLWMVVGCDTSGELEIDYSTGGQDLFRQFVFAGFPVFVPMVQNGHMLAGTGASRFRATHDIGATVYLTVGWAES